jgi:hypothetical protein
MGSWGDQPWESDAGLDLAWTLLGDVTKALSIVLAQPLELHATGSEIDRVKVCCDLLLKLYPYWSPLTRRDDVANAVIAMERVIECLAWQEAPEPSSDEILADLKRLHANLAE